ncbi:hypothetical protein SAMN02745866_03382 [Alteromonadaceae bacterium Bs31]|nr:hypothetical protein SAMN02745866_03382 [Alteromonadaceae bacterium Bs31]
MHCVSRFLFCVSCILLYNQALAETLIVKHYPFINAQEQYMHGLLELALSYSDKEIVYQEDSSRSFTQTSHDELVKALNKDEISLMWSGTSRELEQALQPIRIPLYKGLLGLRLLLINSDGEKAFKQVSDIDSLKGIRFGQGDSWPDTKILQHAKLNVVTSPSYSALFDMLAEKQFDAFPRGLQEPWAEIKAHPDKALSVESDILLVYKLPSYFFVSKENTLLAQELEQGLEAAIADLNFDDYFFYSKQVSEAIEQSQAVGRIVVAIDNPYLPQETPLSRKELWLDVADL